MQERQVSDHQRVVDDLHLLPAADSAEMADVVHVGQQQRSCAGENVRICADQKCEAAVVLVRPVARDRRIHDRDLWFARSRFDVGARRRRDSAVDREDRPGPHRVEQATVEDDLAHVCIRGDAHGDEIASSPERGERVDDAGVCARQRRDGFRPTRPQDQLVGAGQDPAHEGQPLVTESDPSDRRGRR